MDQKKIDSFHRQASDHYMRGEYRLALKAWKQVLELDPSDEKALEGIRLSSLLEDGVDHPLDGEEPGAPDERDGALRRRLDEVDKRIESGDLHEALRAAELLRGERPTDPDVLSALARASLAAGDADQAAQVTSQLLSLDPAYAEAAQLLEECRQLSPPTSPLGSVVLRQAAEARAAAAARGVPAEDPVPSFDAPAFLQDLLAPPAPEERKPAARPAPVEEKGLAPLAPPSPAGGGEPSVDPATVVLRQRVQDLLGQAKQASASGKKEEALGLLSRLLILDEQNVEAITLEEQLRQELGAAARSAEERLTEGVHCFENGEVERARAIFLEVLEAVPGHREAVDYLEKADMRLRRATEAAAPAGAPVRGKAWQTPHPEPQNLPADGLETLKLAPGAEVERTRESRPVVYHRPRRRRLSFAALGVVAALLIVGAVATLRYVGEEELSTPKAAPKTPPPAAKKAPAGTSEARPAASASAVERMKKIADAMSRAQVAFDSGKYEGAVLAYNEVLAIDPEHVEARKKLLEAGALYREGKAENEKLEKARKAFAQGEWEAALGTFYRLPAGLVGPAQLNRYKVNGWYNLGLVSLRAANCAQASSQLGEALALDSSDAGVRRAKSLADACPDQQKDRSYYDVVGGLSFRKLED